MSTNLLKDLVVASMPSDIIDAMIPPEIDKLELSEEGIQIIRNGMALTYAGITFTELAIEEINTLSEKDKVLIQFILPQLYNLPQEKIDLSKLN